MIDLTVIEVLVVLLSFIIEYMLLKKFLVQKDIL